MEEEEEDPLSARERARERVDKEVENLRPCLSPSEIARRNVTAILDARAPTNSSHGTRHRANIYDLFIVALSRHREIETNSSPRRGAASTAPLSLRAEIRYFRLCLFI